MNEETKTPQAVLEKAREEKETNKNPLEELFLDEIGSQLHSDLVEREKRIAELEAIIAKPKEIPPTPLWKLTLYYIANKAKWKSKDPLEFIKLIDFVIQEVEKAKSSTLQAFIEAEIAFLGNKRQELWRFYHEAQLWKEQKEAVKFYDDQIPHLKELLVTLKI